MVDLEIDATTTMSAEATTTKKTAASQSPESKFCRLCLEEGELVANLFEEHLDAGTSGNSALSKKLFDLFQIKYEKTPSLPNSICGDCLKMTESFSTFRENVHKIESELQKRVASLKYGGGMLKVIEETQRPGLNGQPGIFVPEENAIIIEVNPDEDYESSDDEFSMDSDSEAEQEPSVAAIPPVTTSANNLNADTSKSTAQSTVFPMDIETSSAVDPVGANKVRVTSVQTSSNIVEKYYNMEGSPPKTTYSCQYCDIAFSQKNDCAEHVARHDPTGPYICSFCTVRFTSRQFLIAHIRELHDNERPFVCPLCYKRFIRRSDLRKHSIVHTGLRPYTCKICSKTFSRNTNLTKHMRIHNSYKPNTCAKCPRSFNTKAELLRHSQTHTKNFQCTRCSASFTRNDKLVAHEQAHLRRDAEFLKGRPESLVNNNPNTMPPISTDVAHHQQLSQHQLESMIVPMDSYAASTNQNPFNINLSAPALSMNSDDPYRHSILAAQLQHPRASLLQKPTPPPPPPIATPPKQSHFSRHFACEICSQTFTRERDYQRHQALHLDTLFSCKQCGIGFSRREKLARHELEQHAPQYPCNICRIPFTKLSDFELHMKMHELQQTVSLTAQAASLLGSGASLPGFSLNLQSQQQQQQLHHHQPMQHQPMQQQPMQQQPTSMIPQSSSKEFFGGLQQRPSTADMNFYSQMVPTMNLGFYSETRPEDRNGI